MPEEDQTQSLSEFRQMMDESLRTHDSWLALAGLFWLKPGLNRIGSSSGMEVPLPPQHAPAFLGEISLEDHNVTLRVSSQYRVKIDGQDVIQSVLMPDSSGDPTIVHLGPLTWIVIERGERLGIRLWDNSRAEMHAFPGRRWFPERPEFQVEAKFLQHAGPQQLRIESTIGETEFVTAAGTLEFELDGQKLTLQAMGDPGVGLTVLFKDLTNGDTTYSPGRYLALEAVEDDLVELDFNRAYNPPCAFTDYATCPLPPVENYLPIRIEAGERLPDQHGV